MKNKMIGIFVCTLLVATAFPITGAMNVQNVNKQVAYDSVIDIVSKDGIVKKEFFKQSILSENKEHLTLVQQEPKSNSASILRNITITQPLNNDIFRAGDTILINGTIQGWRFKNYTVDYGEGWNSTNWQTTGISLVNNGTSPVISSMIAFWNTSFITRADFFTLRITTHWKSIFNIPLFETLFTFLQKFFPNIIFLKEKITYIKNIYVDPTLKMGWPKRIPWFNTATHEYYYEGYTEPVACDMNNDGQEEIFIFYNKAPLTIYAFEPDGSTLDGWPVEIKNESGAVATPAPSFADMNHDGYKEIVVNGRRGVYIYNHDGSLWKFIKLDLGSCNEPVVETTVADLNNDGNFEIIRLFNFEGKEIVVYDSNGTMLPGWPQIYYDRVGPDGNLYSTWSMSGESAPAVGNFDNDSDLEIVIATCRNIFDNPQDPMHTWHTGGRIVVYNINGSILDGFPVNLTGDVWDSPAVGDINNDGCDEIIVGSYTGLYALNRYGYNCTGWPQLVGYRNYCSPALADFFHDGYLEIVASGTKNDSWMYVFDYLGNVLLGWPQPIIWNDYRSPIIGDVNGDGTPDVLTTAGSGFYSSNPGGGGVYAWDINGTSINGFPKVTEVDAQATATIADIDNDGKVEIVASSNFDTNMVTDEWKCRCSFYVWELGTPIDQDSMEWQVFHHDLQRTGNYGLLIPIFASDSFLYS
jgi:hypothetical protein